MKGKRENACSSGSRSRSGRHPAGWFHLCPCLLFLRRLKPQQREKTNPLSSLCVDTAYFHLQPVAGDPAPSGISVGTGHWSLLSPLCVCVCVLLCVCVLCMGVVLQTACRSLTGNKMAEVHHGLGQEGVVGTAAKVTHPKR